MNRGSSRQRGFALLIVLWTLALLSLLGTQIVATGRQNTQLARNLLNAAVLEAAANGAVQRAIFWTLDGSSHHWRADGTVHFVRIGAANVAVRIENEFDKVNPSIASQALMEALLLQVGADPGSAAAVAAAIVEWRLGSGPAGRPNPTLARYAGAGRDYAPSGAPIASIDELGAVIGMTPELLARLRPHMTIYTDSDPGAVTRDPVVARALAGAGELNPDGDEAQGLVSVTAEARGAGHNRFALKVIVRTNARPEGRRYDILARERIWHSLSW